MTVYLASPATQQQAEHVADMPVLLSFASFSPWLDQYHPSFKRLLIDSGAFSELTGAAKVDLGEYTAWAERWTPHADAIAGLDDISGDWRRSMRNYQAMERGFPTFHDTDPPELLEDLLALAKERRQWIGLGLKPPREGKEGWIRRSCDQIPDDLHVHGWALRAYTYIRRLDSVDSTNWWRDAMKVRRDLPWLTYGECLEIIVKRYQREPRRIVKEEASRLFTSEHDQSFTYLSEDL